MSVLMDIIVSMMIGGIISLITLNANLVIGQTWATYNSGTMVQQMLISDAQIVEGEFRNMGCGVDSTSVPKLTQALDTCITFKMATRPDPGSPVSLIKYYSGSTSELLSTENPNDRFLYRQQDNGTPERVGLVTYFHMNYYTFDNNQMGTPIVGDANLVQIGIVEITLEVQSPFAAYIDEKGIKRFPSAMWKQTRLASQNLKR